MIPTIASCAAIPTTTSAKPPIRARTPKTLRAERRWGDHLDSRTWARSGASWSSPCSSSSRRLRSKSDNAIAVPPARRGRRVQLDSLTAGPFLSLSARSPSPAIRSGSLFLSFTAPGLDPRRDQRTRPRPWAGPGRGALTCPPEGPGFCGPRCLVRLWGAARLPAGVKLQKSRNLTITSKSERSSWELAEGPTGDRAFPSTPAYGAPCSAPVLYNVPSGGTDRGPHVVTSGENTSDFRVITTLVSPDAAPVQDPARSLRRRREIESCFYELKAPPRGPRIVLRSKTPTESSRKFAATSACTTPCGPSSAKSHCFSRKIPNGSPSFAFSGPPGANPR